MTHSNRFHSSRQPLVRALAALILIASVIPAFAAPAGASNDRPEPWEEHFVFTSHVVMDVVDIEPFWQKDKKDTFIFRGLNWVSESNGSQVWTGWDDSFSSYDEYMDVLDEKVNIPTSGTPEYDATKVWWGGRAPGQTAWGENPDPHFMTSCVGSEVFVVAGIELEEVPLYDESVRRYKVRFWADLYELDGAFGGLFDSFGIGDLCSDEARRDIISGGVSPEHLADVLKSSIRHRHYSDYDYMAVGEPSEKFTSTVDTDSMTIQGGIGGHARLNISVDLGLVRTWIGRPPSQASTSIWLPEMTDTPDPEPEQIPVVEIDEALEPGEKYDGGQVDIDELLDDDASCPLEFTEHCIDEEIPMPCGNVGLGCGFPLEPQPEDPFSEIGPGADTEDDDKGPATVEDPIFTDEPIFPETPAPLDEAEPVDAVEPSDERDPDNPYGDIAAAPETDEPTYGPGSSLTPETPEVEDGCGPVSQSTCETIWWVIDSGGLLENGWWFDIPEEEDVLR